MREGWEPPVEEKPRISPKMWAALLALMLLFGKAVGESLIQRFVNGLFDRQGGPTHEEPVTASAPPHTAGTEMEAPIYLPTPEPPPQKARPYRVEVYGTTSVVYPVTTMRVLGSGSYIFQEDSQTKER